MAGFADLVRSLVQVADQLTDSLQASVTHYAWASATKDAYGKVTWGAGTARKCVVLEGAGLTVNDVEAPGGYRTEKTTKLIFPRPVAIDMRDKFALPGGREAFVKRIDGVIDPDTSGTYATEVYLGMETE